MDKRLEAIHDAIREINRNLLLLQNKHTTSNQTSKIEDCLTMINRFENRQVNELKQIIGK